MAMSTCIEDFINGFEDLDYKNACHDEENAISPLVMGDQVRCSYRNHRDMFETKQEANNAICWTCKEPECHNGACFVCSEGGAPVRNGVMVSNWTCCAQHRKIDPRVKFKTDPAKWLQVKTMIELGMFVNAIKLSKELVKPEGGRGDHLLDKGGRGVQPLVLPQDDDDDDSEATRDEFLALMRAGYMAHYTLHEESVMMTHSSWQDLVILPEHANKARFIHGDPPFDLTNSPKTHQMPDFRKQIDKFAHREGCVCMIHCNILQIGMWVDMFRLKTKRTWKLEEALFCISSKDSAMNDTNRSSTLRKSNQYAVIAYCLVKSRSKNPKSSKNMIMGHTLDRQAAKRWKTYKREDGIDDYVPPKVHTHTHLYTHTHTHPFTYNRKRIA
jgi:hypothetical protein